VCLPDVQASLDCVRQPRLRCQTAGSSACILPLVTHRLVRTVAREVGAVWCARLQRPRRATLLAALALERVCLSVQLVPRGPNILIKLNANMAATTDHAAQRRADEREAALPDQAAESARCYAPSPAYIGSRGRACAVRQPAKTPHNVVNHRGARGRTARCLMCTHPCDCLTQ
jgi:hypothetical protein